MVSLTIEGVRRNFGTSSVFMYTVTMTEGRSLRAAHVMKVEHRRSAYHLFARRPRPSGLGMPGVLARRMVPFHQFLCTLPTEWCFAAFRGQSFPRVKASTHLGRGAIQCWGL